MKYLLPIIVFALAGCSPTSDTPPASSAAPAPPKRLAGTGLDAPPDTARVELDTAYGPIVLELDGKDAPQTTANFLHYVDTGKLDDGSFYRVIRAGKAGFAQFNSGSRTYPPIPHEPTTQTHLSHTDGVISTARYGVGTASNEFTIMVGDMSYLDAGRHATPDNLGYAAFGHVVSGMEVVKKILHAPLSQAKPAPGDGPDETLAQPVVIVRARRLP
ncbi:MAG TPA: peptidylprolyl isomerase [Asticcacaulis sp.]|nr:peptidylprolyl isomerase [Asticcacaulis sp.]